MAVPVTPLWLPGLVMEMVEVIVQENEIVPLKPAPSVAVTVTEETPEVEGVPVIDPVVALMLRPVGRPVAVQVKD